MKCEFEEKQFEHLLNRELSQEHHLLYATGQSLENSVGFDAAVFSRHPVFWEYFNFTSPPFPPGREIRDEWFRKLDRDIDHFPPFQCNVFIQHKRPQYLTNSNAREWDEWEEKYYRYEIRNGDDDSQHAILIDLENSIGNDGIVTYTSPVFYTFESLFDHNRNQTLVENTNFQTPQRIGHHKYYTYINPGRTGTPAKAFSEPEPIEHFNFLEKVKELIALERKHESNREFLSNIANEVRNAIGEDKQSLFRRITDKFSEKYSEKENIKNIFTVGAFCFLYNLVWSIGVHPEDLPD